MTFETLNLRLPRLGDRWTRGAWHLQKHHQLRCEENAKHQLSTICRREMTKGAIQVPKSVLKSRTYVFLNQAKKKLQCCPGQLTAPECSHTFSHRGRSVGSAYGKLATVRVSADPDQSRNSSDESKQVLKRVAVIGSGVSGLAAAKAFLQAGQFQVSVYEQANELGGLWAKTYDTARIQNGKPMYEFSDHPMPAEFPLLPSKDQVKEYLRTYAQRFSVDQHIEYGTRVASMRKAHLDRYATSISFGRITRPFARPKWSSGIFGM